MGLFGYKSRKTKELEAVAQQQAIELQAKAEAWEKLNAYIEQKAAMFDNGIEWAKQVYAMLKWQNGIPVFDYDFAKFINDGYIKNPHVYSVINKIVQPGKSVPWQVYRIKDKQNFKRFLSFKADGKINEAELFARKSLELVEGTPLNDLLEHPNEYQAWGDFVEVCMAYRLLIGNDYISKLVPAGFKYPTKLYNLPAQAVAIIPGDWRQPVKGYKMMFGTNEKYMEADTIIHRKRFNPTFNFGVRPEDYLYGLAPLKPLCRTVARSNEGIDASLALILNGIPPGILSPKNAENGNPILDDDMKAMQKAWVSHHGGGKRANLPVISPVELYFQAFGLKSADMELLEADKLDMKTIAQVYNVPLPIISDDASTYNNMAEALKRLWLDAIVPELCALRDSLNNDVVEAYNKANNSELWIDFDLKAVPALQEDKKTKGELHLSEMEHGIWTGNEFRQLMDYEQVPGEEFLEKRMLKSGLRFVDEPLPNNQNNNQNNGNNSEETQS